MTNIVSVNEFIPISILLLSISLSFPHSPDLWYLLECSKHVAGVVLGFSALCINHITIAINFLTVSYELVESSENHFN